MSHGLTAPRLKKLRETLGADRRTLERWQAWWKEVFASSACWKELRGRLGAQPLDEACLPASLLRCFGQGVGGLVNLMRALGPLSTQSAQGVQTAAIRGT
jgi:hypothetical protein